MRGNRYSMFALPEEPIGHYRLAAAYGEDVARRQMSIDLAHEYCRILAGYSADMLRYEKPAFPNWFGLRLCWACNDAQRAYEDRADDASRAIRRAVRPLFESGASTAAVEEAAGAANADRLEWDAIFPILRDELTRHRRYNRGRR